MTMTMTPHRRQQRLLLSLSQRLMNSAMIISLICFSVSDLLLSSQRRSMILVEAFSIGTTQQQRQRGGMEGIIVNRNIPTLRAYNNNKNSNYGYMQNSTSTASSVTVSSSSYATDKDTDTDTVSAYQRSDDAQIVDDIRLQQSLEDALSELESFQTTHEVSLLFPDMSIEEDTNKTPFPQQRQQEEVQRHKSAGTTLISNSNNDAQGLAVLSLNEEDTHVIKDLDDQAAIVRARWLLVVAAALYGTNFSVVKLLGDDMHMPVGISTSLRFGLAAFATLPWLLDGVIPAIKKKINSISNSINNSEEQLQKESINNIDPRVMATLWGLEVGMWNSIGYIAQAVGLETTLASKSAFLCSMAVVVVPLLDWISGKKMLSRQWVGAMMALVGVAFLELGGSGGTGDAGVAVTNGFSSLTSDITTGDVLSMIQPFTFGLGFWRMEKAMNQYPEEAPRMTAAQLMAVFISSVLYGLWTLDVFDGGLAGLQSSLSAIGTSFPWHQWFTDPSILFALFWTGCITTALTIYMETLALESLSAAETTLIFSTEPLWGSAVAVALMGEQMGINAAVGGGLILTACIYSNLGINGIQNMLKQGIDRISSTGLNYKNNRDSYNDEEASPSLSKSIPDHWPDLPSEMEMTGSSATFNIVSNLNNTRFE